MSSPRCPGCGGEPMPCPFCGSRDVTLRRVPPCEDMPQYGCCHCQAEGPLVGMGEATDADALAAWNTRAASVRAGVDWNVIHNCAHHDRYQCVVCEPCILAALSAPDAPDPGVSHPRGSCDDGTMGPCLACAPEQDAPRCVAHVFDGLPGMLGQTCVKCGASKYGPPQPAPERDAPASRCEVCSGDGTIVVRGDGRTWSAPCPACHPDDEHRSCVEQLTDHYAYLRDGSKILVGDDGRLTHRDLDERDAPAAPQGERDEIREIGEAAITYWLCDDDWPPHSSPTWHALTKMLSDYVDRRGGTVQARAGRGGTK
jgi:Lar family restriction alleviation protein